MESDSKLLGYYNYTVILTYVGMLIGFLGILYSFEGNVTKSVICLMIAGVCDMFDGAIASTRERTKEEKHFGIQIDSLSDLICFGVLPAVMVSSMDMRNTVIMVISCLYVLCSLIRLAYFNVDEMERQEQEDGSRSVYYGLPVTTAALLIPIAYAIAGTVRLETSALLASVLGDMALLFLIPFPLKKPKFIGKICMLMLGIGEFIFVLLTFGGMT